MIRTVKRIHGLLWVAIATLQCLSTAASAQTVQLITLEGQKEMLAAPGTDSVGAPNADVTIVEYFDYNCPFCKKLTPVFQALLAADHRVAIVYKDWPILGEVSVYAARCALAARWQHKYLVAHDALMSGPHLAQSAEVDALLQHAGIDLNALSKDRTVHSADIDALLARNEEESRALGLKGTPGLVVGRQLVPGIVELSDLQQLVAKARHGK
jgi:protein-disulfide isomerase